MPNPPTHPAPLKRFLRKTAGGIPFWTTLGMEVVECAPGRGRVRVRFSRGLINSNGVVHGGVVCSAADAAMAVALLSLMKEGERMATTEMKINFIKPVQDCDVIAEAHILHRGGHTAVGEVTVRDSAGNLVAKALATYAITGPAKPKKKLKV
jgi:acyl-CoA thioesterase